MSLLAALFLGVLQAATEFLPVSSTAHLLVFGELLGHDLADPRFRAFATIIQTGTTLAVLVYFRAEIFSLVTAGLRSIARRRPLETPQSRLAWFIVLGTIPAAVLGKLFEERIEALGNWVIAGSLVGLGLVLLAAERCARHLRTVEDVGAKDALLIGLGQALALVPGSRAPARRSPPACCSASRARRRRASASSSPYRSSSARAATSSGRPCRCCAASRAGRSPRWSGRASPPSRATSSSTGCSGGCARARPTSSWSGGSRRASRSRSSSGRACSPPATRRRRRRRRPSGARPRRRRRSAPRSAMSLAALRSALAAHPWGAAPVSEIPAAHFPLGGFVRAAVLVPLHEQRRRHARPPHAPHAPPAPHAGQIASPGGHVDPEEEHLAAALREAQEEIGLDPAHADVLGRLSETLVLTSAFRLTPWVASVPYPYPYAAAAHEVEEILHVPARVAPGARGTPDRAPGGVGAARGRSLLHRRRRHDLGRDRSNPGGAALHLEDPVKIHPVIMAGGSGTRFWPLSRKDRPKQFLPLAGDAPLLAATVARLPPLAKVRSHLRGVRTPARGRGAADAAGAPEGALHRRAVRAEHRAVRRPRRAPRRRARSAGRHGDAPRRSPHREAGRVPRGARRGRAARGARARSRPSASAPRGRRPATGT